MSIRVLLLALVLATNSAMSRKPSRSRALHAKSVSRNRTVEGSALAEQRERHNESRKALITAGSDRYCIMTSISYGMVEFQVSADVSIETETPAFDANADKLPLFKVDTELSHNEP